MPDKLTHRWIMKQARDPDIIYIGVFLPPMCQKKLIKKFGKEHSEVLADHMTIWHFQDGGESKLESLPLGKSITLKITGVVSDDKAQVVIVRPPAECKPRSGRTPHITLTAAPGTNAAYSNELIARSGRKPALKGLPTVTGRLGWYDGKNVHYDIF